MSGWLTHRSLSIDGQLEVVMVHQRDVKADALSQPVSSTSAIASQEPVSQAAVAPVSAVSSAPAEAFQRAVSQAPETAPRLAFSSVLAEASPAVSSAPTVAPLVGPSQAPAVAPGAAFAHPPGNGQCAIGVNLHLSVWVQRVLKPGGTFECELVFRDYAFGPITFLGERAVVAEEDDPELLRFGIVSPVLEVEATAIANESMLSLQ